MTGAELKQLREDLGEAIGRPLSVGDMAKLCGLPPETNVASADAAPVPNEACTPSTLAGFLKSRRGHSLTGRSVTPTHAERPLNSSVEGILY